MSEDIKKRQSSNNNNSVSDINTHKNDWTGTEEVVDAGNNKPKKKEPESVEIGSPSKLPTTLVMSATPLPTLTNFR